MTLDHQVNPKCNHTTPYKNIRILYDLTYMWYLKQNKPKYEQTNWVHGYREQIAGYQRWGGEVGGSVESGWSGWRGLKSGNPQLQNK